jgi:hypothetical protein
VLRQKWSKSNRISAVLSANPLYRARERVGDPAILIGALRVPWHKMRVSEADRNARGAKVSQRPDWKTYSAMKAAGTAVFQEKTAGHVPGHMPGARYAHTPAT